MTDFLFKGYSSAKEKRCYESQYQKFKRKNNYRKSNKDCNHCGVCINSIAGEYHNRRYWKCELLGMSHSVATDIRKYNVCDNFEK